MTFTAAGVDVGRDYLDVAIAPSGRAFRAPNVAAGVRHLKGLIDRWGVELALAAYNAGEGAVKKFNGVPPYRETRNYVKKIMRLYKQFRGEPV